jgi:hypothetical protein
MARQRKSGRFTKSTRRRRSKPKTNLGNLAVSALVANSVTQGMFNTNLYEFFTGNTGAKYGFGFDGSSVLSLPELLGIGDRVAVGGNYASGLSLQKQLVKNFKSNWPMLVVGVVGIPIAANVAMKLIRKPIILPANRMLKNVGLDVKI